LISFDIKRDLAIEAEKGGDGNAIFNDAMGDVN